MPQLSHSTVLSLEVRRGGVAELNIVSERFRLPDGRPGAKWAGLVFALHDEAWIDPEEPGVLPALCRAWNEPQAWWRWQPGVEGGEGYLFLDGTAAARDQVAGALRAAGLVVVRAGPNMSGEPGDWFLRVGGGDPRPVLAEMPGSPQPAPGEATLRERLLGEALERALLERDQARAQLAETRLVEMRAEPRIVPPAVVPEAAPVAAPPLEAAPPPLRPAVRLRFESELQQVVAALLPGLTLLRDSLTFIAVELPDRAGIWRVLGALARDEGGRPEGWKMVKGAAGWWERHFRTGQDDQGRIYARRDVAGGGWAVLVSHKQAQTRDMRWLGMNG
jgi:hypothetical protein